MDDDVFPQYPRRLRPREAAWIADVLNPEPEPARHRCGRCNNGTGVYNPDCPNARRTT